MFSFLKILFCSENRKGILSNSNPIIFIENYLWNSILLDHQKLKLVPKVDKNRSKIKQESIKLIESQIIDKSINKPIPLQRQQLWHTDRLSYGGSTIQKFRSSNNWMGEQVIFLLINYDTISYYHDQLLSNVIDITRKQISLESIYRDKTSAWFNEKANYREPLFFSHNGHFI